MDYFKQTSYSFYKIKQHLNKFIKYSYFIELPDKESLDSWLLQMPPTKELFTVAK